MKKIISVLAMALLVIGAAQAQNQTKRMVIHLNDGQVVKYNTEYVEDVTFEIIDLPNVPTTIEEAKAMLVGYWKVNSPSNEDEIEGGYFIITEDLEVLLCMKIKDSATGYYAEYAGKYVVFGSFGEVIFPNEEDPTTFYLGSQWYFGTNLHIDSFDYNQDNGGIYTFPCVRVEPFEYIFRESGLMKK